MRIPLELPGKALYLSLFKCLFRPRRWAYGGFVPVRYWMMWIIVAAGRALDHVLFPGHKRQPVRSPIFIVAPPRSGTTLTQKLLALDEESFVHNAL